MEKIKHQTSNKKNLNKLAIVSLATLLSFSACQNNTKNNTTESQTQKIETSQTTNIPMTREYKIYKLKLNSIVNLKSDINKAWQKIGANTELQNILTQEDIAIHTLLPQIIKESGMDNNKTSKSWASWYMQLRDVAIEEIYRHYDLKWLHLDKNNPIDNIILGWLYKKIIKSKITTWMRQRNMNINKKNIESLTVISYNIGITRLFEHIDRSRSKTVEQLTKYFAKHIGLEYDPATKIDPVYNIAYTDIFWWKQISSIASREEKKIYEWCRYENIIKALSSYLEENDSVTIIGEIQLNKQETLFSKIKKMKEEWIFKDTASVNEICKIILESNWFKENETPTGKTLILIQEPLNNLIQ